MLRGEAAKSFTLMFLQMWNVIEVDFQATLAQCRAVTQETIKKRKAVPEADGQPDEADRADDVGPGNRSETDRRPA